MKLLNVIKIFAFGLLLVSAALGQKLTKAPAATNQSKATPRIACKGQPVPKGFVVVGYKVSAKCGENPELVIKRPAEAEIVCAESPIPDSYHVANRLTSTDCSFAGKDAAEALSIVSNGPIGLVTTNSPSRSYDRFDDVTRVQMPEALLYREDRHSEFDPQEIYISASYAYRGQTPGPPTSVTLYFRDRVLFDLGFDSVNFIADGQRFSFDTVLSNNKSESVENRDGGYTTYSNCTYSVAMPVGSFRRIASSSNVEVRAAGREFNLAGSAFSALRAFAREIQH